MKLLSSVAWAMMGLAMGGAGSFAAEPFDRAAALAMSAAWNAPVAPRHLVGNIYYVGAMGVSSYLITTPAGHILLDTGLPETPSSIRRGVEQLGFKVSDIKVILSSHAHFDHTGGHAEMKRVTGAAVVASAEDARILESGGADDFMPYPKDLAAYGPVTVDRIVGDGETVSLGGVALTANLTPGHTRGATTWTMDVTEAGKVYRVVFFSSASINSGTRLTGAEAAYPEIVDDYEATFRRLKALPCDIFFAPHGGQFAMGEKFARIEAGEPGAVVLVDPEGFKNAVAWSEKAFRELLAKERDAR